MEIEEQQWSKALVFCPHPDDAEFSAGGTMAKWSDEGKEVILCVVTNGAMGNNDPNVDREWLIKTRREEQQKAAAINGVKDVIFLGYEDGHIEDNHELRRDMIREIRRHKPDLVMGPDPSMWYFAPFYLNHPDHRAVGAAFIAAVNPGATTLPLYRSELYDKGFEPHQVSFCLLTFSPSPDYFVDIAPNIERKIDSIMVHNSQTPEFRPGMSDRIKEMSAMYAGLSGKGYEFAEGYKYFYFEKGSIPDRQ